MLWEGKFLFLFQNISIKITYKFLFVAGVGVSNKVLECLVLRFARDAVLTSEMFVLAMLRLHLAHGESQLNLSQNDNPFIILCMSVNPERYHALDTKTKSNPLSLEEVC